MAEEVDETFKRRNRARADLIFTDMTEGAADLLELLGMHIDDGTVKDQDGVAVRVRDRMQAVIYGVDETKEVEDAIHEQRLINYISLATAAELILTTTESKAVTQRACDLASDVVTGAAFFLGAKTVSELHKAAEAKK